MDTICLNAYAKINLGLDVVRRKEDGYHEVRMIMQTISLHDIIKLNKIKETGIQVHTNSKDLPTDENNLVYRAAKMLFDEFQPSEGIRIQLEKKIPIAAGLAGGSSDAAAVLRGMNHIYHFNLSDRELMQRAVKLGADVPYCIVGGTMLAEGIGEKLTELPPVPPSYILIAKPDIAVSTKWVYENLHISKLRTHPDIDSMVQAIKKQDMLSLSEIMENVLEMVTETEYPIIRDIKVAMEEQQAIKALMSGSGPTVFGIFSSYEKIELAYQRLKEREDIKELYIAQVVGKYEKED